MNLVVLCASMLIAHGALGPIAAAQDEASKRAHQLGETISLGNVTHPESEVAWGRAEAVVEARTADVIAILNDYSQYAGIFPYFQKSKVLSQRGGDAIVYLEAKVLHGAATLWSQVRMSSKLLAGTTVVEARMMKGKGNIEQLLARWEITPIAAGQRSLVAFQILVDPALPVPNILVSDEMRKGAGQAMRALRKRLYQRSSYAARGNNAM